jgi:hypothetical protein
VTERPDRTAQGYRRFRCRDCGKQLNERSDSVLNRASVPSDIIAFVVFCRLRYRPTPRDLSQIMLLRGFTVSHECIRQWGGIAGQLPDPLAVLIAQLKTIIASDAAPICWLARWSRALRQSCRQSGREMLRLRPCGCCGIG